jgi:apolipoprotein N-acyltransferase
MRPARAALLGYLCGVIWYAGNCYWIYQTMHIYGDIPELPSFGILILFALYLGLYHALFGWLVGLLRARYSVVVTLLAVPFLWVAVELARARITSFPWDLLGYTQVDNFLLTRLAPVGGVMLLSFVIVAINALFAAVLLANATKQKVRLGLVGVLVVVGISVVGMHAPAADLDTHTAVLLQENLPAGAVGRELPPYPQEQKYADFIGASLHPVDPVRGEISELSKGEVIVWPEAPADFFTVTPLFQTEMSGLSRYAAAPVIVGSVGVDIDATTRKGYHEFGSAAVFDKDGSYVGRYDKIHRVPWGEYVPYAQFFSFAGKLISGVGDMEPGTEHKLFQLNHHKVGIFICYESVFGDEVRQFVRNGAEVLVNISDDGWYGDSGAPWQHLDMARMRAIENERWILRDTNTGITTAIDPHGRGIFTTPRHVRAAFSFGFDYSTGTTFYTRYGDWFAWLCAVLTVGLVGFALLPRKLA